LKLLLKRLLLLKLLLLTQWMLAQPMAELLENNISLP
jgi:hypothetical protein